jgi:hypothetical protein
MSSQQPIERRTLSAHFQLLLMDSISYIGEDARGQIVVSGSHGGSAAVRYAIPIRPRLAVFNDAGGGKDDAGIVGLTMLEAAGIAALAVQHTSARIGEALDTWESGVISVVNGPAAALGFRPGQALQQAVRAWAQMPSSA